MTAGVTVPSSNVTSTLFALCDARTSRTPFSGRSENVTAFSHRAFDVELWYGLRYEPWISEIRRR